MTLKNFHYYLQNEVDALLALYYTQTEVDNLFKKTMEIAFPLDGIGKGATAPTITRLGNTIGWAFTIGDDGYMSFEVPLSWDEDSDITIKLHVYVNDTYAASSGEVRWQGTYSCVPEDESEPVDGATHTGTLDSGDIDIPAVAKVLQEITLGAIPKADIACHDTIFILLSRIALVAGSDPGSEPVVVAAEYEWITDKLGEAL